MSYKTYKPSEFLELLSSYGLEISAHQGGSYQPDAKDGFVTSLGYGQYDLVPANRDSILISDGSAFLEAVTVSEQQLKIKLFV